jgi:ketosteroid isomerase-like protein
LGKSAYDPDLVAVSWKTSKVEVARSGDMAYLTGTSEVITKDPSGKPVNDRGKYLSVWKKRSGGTWKTVVDIWNSDLPLPVAAEKR